MLTESICHRNQASWIELTAVRTKIGAGRFSPQRAGDSGLVTPFLEFGACSAEMAPEAVLHGLRQ